MSRIVVALGGNAFAAPDRPLTMAGQLQFAHTALEQLLPVLSTGSQLVITHGNGPQVGQILTRVEQSLGKAYALPLEVCVAESEGELGYVLTLALHNVLSACSRVRPIAGLLTQVVVDPADSAFSHPTKPIGVFYNRSQADDLRRQGFHLVEDAGRGYRRVVPSPQPLEIVEVEVIRKLLDLGVLVIAAGGGGIPVIRRGTSFEGVEAVVDKDMTSALLADQLDARMLLILTDVPCAYRGYRTPGQAPIHQTTPAELASLIQQGHFAAGSMLPKIEAALRFVSRPDRQAIITNPSSLADALSEKAGTILKFTPQS